MNPTFRTRISLVLILALGAVFRFYGMDWDQGRYFHPDERAIIMKVTDLRWPDGMNTKFFAYGSLPFYLLKAVAFGVGFISEKYNTFASMYLVGRALSAVFDLGTLVLIFFIGKTLKNSRLGLLASLLYAMSVLPIQLSHFYAVDTLLTFFMTATLLCLLASMNRTIHPSKKTQKRRMAIFVCAGICFGLAAATKISALVLLAPIGIAVIIYDFPNIKRIGIHGVLLCLTALVFFFIAQPYALLDSETFIRQTMEQQAMTKNPFVFPYTLQYVGKIPYWHEAKNIFLWGLGPALGSLAFLGAVYMTYMTVKMRSTKLFVLLLFFWLYVLLVGRFTVGFMRYMLPVYPILTLGAAYLLYRSLSHRSRFTHPLFLLILLILILWPVSFLSVYSLPNTRNQALKWINEHIPEGSVIAQEHWDDGIANPSLHRIVELPLYEPDTTEKWNTIRDLLTQSDYLIIASHRLYAPLSKLTECASLPEGKCYRQTAEYYDRLFDNTLGFVKIQEFRVVPKIPLFNIPIDDMAADESFTVYDHPKIMIYKKVYLVPYL